MNDIDKAFEVLDAANELRDQDRLRRMRLKEIEAAKEQAAQQERLKKYSDTAFRALMIVLALILAAAVGLAGYSDVLPLFPAGMVCGWFLLAASMMMWG